MNKKARFRLMIFLSVLALTLTMVTEQIMITTAVSSPAKVNVMDNSFSREDIAVIAAEGDSVLVQYARFGMAESAFPSDLTSSADLMSATAWMVFASDQASFADYLLRRPVDVPDGLTLYLFYDSAGATTDTMANNAATAVSNYMGTSFMLAVKKISGPSGARTTMYVYIALDNNFEDALDLTLQVTTGGFNALMDKTTIMNAPVKVTGIGAIPMGMSGNSIAIGIISYVQTGAITGGGASPYTLSTATLFPNKIITPLDGNGLSRIRFNFPYLITVVPNGISPKTTNPVPQLTGTFIWDLRSPMGVLYDPIPAEFKVTFTIDANEFKQYPLVRGTVSTSQELLSQGTLEFNYEFKNEGTADAYNIKSKIPMGPELQWFLTHGFETYILRTDLVYKDPSITSDYILSFAATDDSDFFDIHDYVDDFAVKFLEINGWYRDLATNGLVSWTNVSSIEIFNFDYVYDTGLQQITLHFDLSIDTPNGLPTPLYNAIQEVLLVAYNQDEFLQMLDSASNPLDTAYNYIFGNDGLKPERVSLATAKQAFNNTLNDVNLYEKKHFIDFESGDFSFETITTPDGSEDVVLKYEYAGPLAPGQSVNASWRINNVPSGADTFTIVVPSIGNDGNNDFLRLDVVDHTFQEMFQYLFALADYDGRFTARDLPNDFFWLPTENPDARMSVGAIFSWEDANGFGYFGVTNGLNFQYADDDEAILVAKLTSDKTSLYVGDLITFTLEITNTGNIAANDVFAVLYHARLTRGFRLGRIEDFAYMDFGTIGAGETKTMSVTVNATSFLGYHPVFAAIDFVTDVGQGPVPVTDFFDTGVTQWDQAGEAEIVTFSNLAGALLQPRTFDRTPAFPNPVLEITTTTSDPDANQMFTHTLTIKNVGGSPTNVTVTQSVDTTLFAIQGVSSTKGSATTIPITGTSFSIISVTGITLNPGEEVVITMEFQLLSTDGGILPHAIVTYTSLFENELGDRPVTGSSFFSAQLIGGAGAGGLLGLSAEAQASGSAEEQATETQDYNGYSSATSVGASVQTRGDTEVSGKEIGFLGTNEVLASLGFGLAVFTLLRRKRLA